MIDDSETTGSHLYKDLAWLWPVLSPPEDYAEEAVHWRRVLREKLGDGRHTILELGAGGGHNLSHLTKEFDAVAVDLSPEMLDNCKRLNPTVELHVGDMRNVRLGRLFDAVIIHDACDYLITEGDLRATFTTAFEHLRSGGVFVVSPDYLRETFTDNHLYSTQRCRGDLHLTFIEYTWDPDPSDTQVKCLMTFLIRDGEEIRVEHDLHTIGLFSRQTWLDLMASAGFVVGTVDYPVHEDSRQAHLFVGVKK